MLYLKLFHGRQNPTEQMDDWGADGPIFGPYNFVHTTYANRIAMGREGEDVHELNVVEDLIYYDGRYYGDWSVIPEDICRQEDPSLRQDYDVTKTQLPQSRAKSGTQTGQDPVKVIVYVKGGICQEVKTNLPQDSWEYCVVDYDNEPDLPDDHVPFTEAEMKTLPSMAAVFDLIEAATKVIDNWESGDLAGSVRQMADVLKKINQP